MKKRKNTIGEPVVFINKKYYKDLVKMPQVTESFSRTQLSVCVDEPYGTVSRVISTWKNEGYVEDTGIKSSYNGLELKRNPELKDHRLNYSHNHNVTSMQVRKTKKWPELIDRWGKFLGNI